MDDSAKAKIKKQLIDLTKAPRRGSKAESPMVYLKRCCPTLLDLMSEALSSIGAKYVDVEDLTKALLEEVAFKSEAVTVQQAGDLLGLTPDNIDIRPIFDNYKEKHRSDAPAQPVRFGRQVRQIIAAHRDELGYSITWNARYESDWMQQFVDALCIYLDNDHGKLSTFARRQGCSPIDEDAAEVTPGDTIVLQHMGENSESLISTASSRRSTPVNLAGRATQPQQSLAGVHVGKPINDYSMNPLLLGIHPAIELGQATAGLEKLPLYVPRVHDDLLAEIVARTATGESAIVMLVGESSTGKTRACWEAVRSLGDQWRLWYPISPSEPEALLDGIARVGPRTVLWLNEVQRYLEVTLLGQQCAAHLQELLFDTVRSPVLILGTIWPRDWMTLMTKPVDGGPDPHSRARALLTGSSIEVPDAFTSKALTDLRKVTASDPRLAHAARMAPNGQITQYLAGVPEVDNRYRTAPAVAKALIHAAMDARRLGVSEDLPLEFFARAVSGYLTDVQWNQIKENSLEEALDWTGAPCKGVLGPLTRIKPRIDGTDSSPSRYQLADSLAQQSFSIREMELPPATFWEAATICMDYMELGSQATLAHCAHQFGFFRPGAQLRKNSLQQGGSAWAAGELIEMIANVSPGTLNDAVSWAVHHIDASDIFGLEYIARILQQRQASDQLSYLLVRAANRITFDNIVDVIRLIRILHNVGCSKALAILLARDLALQVPLSNDFSGAEELLRELRKVEAYEQAEILADRVAVEQRANKATPEDAVRQGDTSAIIRLLRDLNAEGTTAQLHQLLGYDLTSHVALDDFWKLGSLWKTLYEVRASKHVEKLATRIAEYAQNADSHWVINLHVMAIELEFDARLVALLPRRFPGSDFSQQNYEYVAWLWDNWTEPSDRAQIVEIIENSVVKPEAYRWPVEVISLVYTLRQRDRKIADDMIVRTATRASLTNAGFVAWLLGALRELNRDSEIAGVLAKNPAFTVSVDDAGEVASLLRELQRLGSEDQIDTLLTSRSLVDTVPLTRPSDAGARPNGVIALLIELDSLGHRDHALALAARVASDIECSHAAQVVQLIKAMHGIGAVDQLAVLATRAAFELDLSRPLPLVELLSAYHELELKTETARLLSRDPVGGLKRIRSISQSLDVANLLEILRAVGADTQAKRLVTRLATEPGFILLDDKGALARAMRRAGAHDELEALSIQAANLGQFDLYLKINPHSARKFRFGREPDGSPSQPWGWHDLD